ncbi:hypothetical protein Tco_1216973 [Tanacetum coccineum]
MNTPIRGVTTAERTPFCSIRPHAPLGVANRTHPWCHKQTERTLVRCNGGDDDGGDDDDDGGLKVRLSWGSSRERGVAAVVGGGDGGVWRRVMVRIG